MLTITGGWTEVPGNPCGQQSGSPYSTRLTGNAKGGRAIMTIIGRHSYIGIHNLSFSSGDSDIGAGLRFDSSTAGAINVDRC